MRFLRLHPWVGVMAATAYAVLATVLHEFWPWWGWPFSAVAVALLAALVGGVALTDRVDGEHWRKPR